MFLQHKTTGALVEIVTIGDLYDPCLTEIIGKSHAGEEMQDPAVFDKSELIFPSGEPLPCCWLNPHYRETQPRVMAGVA